MEMSVPETVSSSRVLVPCMALIGPGLIGGSLALALREAGVVGEIIGFDRDEDNLRLALELGIIDRIARDDADVSQADLVFLATPVLALGEVAGRYLPLMKSGAVLTDGGSVKGRVVEQILPLIPEGIHFVPGHPISGTEKSGAAAAIAGLYRNRRCILTPLPQTDPDALALVRRLWEAAGSEVVLMEVEKHDRILAAISHLPHMVAYSLVNAVGSYDRYEENILEYSAGGFRDFTRIASSDPLMWRDIALTNRDALLEMMERCEAFFAELKEDVRKGEGEKLLEFFQRSKSMRDAIL